MDPRKTPRLLRRLLPPAVVLLLLGAWWLRSREPVLATPLKYLLVMLCARLALLGGRAAARWRLARRHVPTLPRWVLLPWCVLTAWWAVPALFTGFSTAAGWDFPVHAWHTHVLVEELLPALRGWTWTQNYGWAEGDDYSLLAYLPAALLHLLSFKLVPLEAAVALEVATVTVAVPWALAMFLGRGLPVAVVAVGAVLVLLDPGFFHAGGLIPLTVAGMWPVRLSMALCVGAMWAADRYILAPDARRLAVTLVLVTLAAHTHVVGITYVGAALGLWWVVRSGERVGWRAWLLLVVGCVASMATTLWMVLPFYALKDFQAPLGEGTQLLRVVLDRTLEMKWFDRMSPLEGALGLAGTAWLLRRRHLAGRVAVVGFVVATLWLSLDLLTALAPQDKKELVTRVQWARYDFFARNPLLFAAGVALALGTSWVWRWWWHPRRGQVVVTLSSAAVALVVASADVYGPALWAKSNLKRAHVTPMVDDLPYTAGLMEAAQWVKAHETPDTLLVVDTPLGHEPAAHVAGLVAMRTGLNVMAVHRQGTFVFKDFGPRDSQNNYAELAGAGATHWVSVGQPTGGAPVLNELGAFSGNVHLYELPRWAPDQRVASEETVTVETWDRERLVLRGPATGYAVTLRARWHPRWTVAAGGAALQRTTLLPGSRPIFMRLVVPPGDGGVELAYGAAADGARGLAYSVFGLLLAVASVVAARRWLRPQASLRMSSTNPPAPHSV